MTPHHPSGRRTTANIAVAAVAVLLGAGLVSCTSDVPDAVQIRRGADSRDGVGLRLTRTALTTAEQSEASTFAESYVVELVGKAPQLTGLAVDSIAPVFDEVAPEPIGAMVRLVVPAVVASVQLDLIRLHDSTPESIPSTITNLRALDVIYLFVGERVIHFGIEPQPTDAQDPKAATAVTPIDPNSHRNPAFGGNE